ncbi:unnamed protein product [Pedinophyceae sp. YPF-701]|nr:unnamed protein product [Pedinophyceae sp. YPF-701]
MRSALLLFLLTLAVALVPALAVNDVRVTESITFSVGTPPASSVTVQSANASCQPQFGTVTFARNTNPGATDYLATYRPFADQPAIPPGSSREDVFTFQYFGQEGGVGAVVPAPGIFPIRVSILPVNRPPQCRDFGTGAGEGASIRTVVGSSTLIEFFPKSDLDIDGDRLTYTYTTDATKFTLDPDPQGTEWRKTFIPNVNFAWSATGDFVTIPYTVTDCAVSTAWNYSNPFEQCSTVGCTYTVPVGAAGGVPAPVYCTQQESLCVNTTELTDKVHSGTEFDPLVATEDETLTGLLLRENTPLPVGAPVYWLMSQDTEFTAPPPSDRFAFVNLQFGKARILCHEGPNGTTAAGAPRNCPSNIRGALFEYTPNPNFFGATGRRRAAERDLAQLQISQKDQLRWKYSDGALVTDLDRPLFITTRAVEDPTVGRFSTVRAFEATAAEAADLTKFTPFTLAADDVDESFTQQQQLFWIPLNLDSVNGTVYRQVQGDAVVAGSALAGRVAIPMAPSGAQGTNYTLTLYWKGDAGASGRPIATLKWFAVSSTVQATLSGLSDAQFAAQIATWTTQWDAQRAAGARSGSIGTNGFGGVALEGACRGGFFRSPATGRCEQCPLGQFLPPNLLQDRPTCSPCGVGTQAPFLGTVVCEPCPVGRYTDVQGTVNCTVCPSVGMTTRQEGSRVVTDCICKRRNPLSVTTKLFLFTEGGRGYYGHPGVRCFECPGPSIDEVDLTSDTAIEAAEWVKCEEDGQILPINREGFFVEAGPEIGSAATVSKCTPAEACPEHDSVEDMQEEPCADCYTGTRCAECSRADGEQCYRLQGTCRSCPESAQVGFVIVIAIILALFAPFMFKLTDVLRAAPSLNISLNFVQITAIFPKLNVPWPDSLIVPLEWLSLVNLNIELAHPECISDSWTWESKWRLTLLSPLIVAGFFLCYFALAVSWYGLNVGLRKQLCKTYPPPILAPVQGRGQGFKRLQKKALRILLKVRSRDDVMLLTQKLTRVMLTFLKVAYIFLTAAVFEFLDCNVDAVSGNRFLRNESSVQCFTLSDAAAVQLGNDTAPRNVWKDNLAIFCVAAFMYPVGILALYVGMLVASRKDMDNPNVDAMLEPVAREYRLGFNWWIVTVLIRKIALLAAPLIFPSETDENGLRQSLFSIAILLIALVTHIYFYPHDTEARNTLESIGTFANFLTVFVGMSLLAHNSDDQETSKITDRYADFLEVLAIIMNGVAATAGAIVAYMEMSPFLMAHVERWRAKRRFMVNVKRAGLKLDLFSVDAAVANGPANTPNSIALKYPLSEGVSREILRDHYSAGLAAVAGIAALVHDRHGVPQHYVVFADWGSLERKLKKPEKAAAFIVGSHEGEPIDETRREVISHCLHADKQAALWDTGSASYALSVRTIVKIQEFAERAKLGREESEHLTWVGARVTNAILHRRKVLLEAGDKAAEFMPDRDVLKRALRRFNEYLRQPVSLKLRYPDKIPIARMIRPIVRERVLDRLCAQSAEQCSTVKSVLLEAVNHRPSLVQAVVNAGQAAFQAAGTLARQMTHTAASNATLIARAATQSRRPSEPQATMYSGASRAEVRRAARETGMMPSKSTRKITNAKSSMARNVKRDQARSLRWAD